MKTINYVIKFIGDWYLSAGLIVLTFVAAFSLHVNAEQTSNIKDLLVRADTEATRVDRESCISRQEGREALRTPIETDLSIALKLVPEQAPVYQTLLDELPAVQCPEEGEPVPAAPTATTNEENFTLSTWSPERIAAIIGAIIPILTALSTHVAAAAKVKAGIAFVLAVIAGPVVTFIQTNQSLISWLSAKSALVAWGVALLTYLGAWKPIVSLKTRSFVAPDKGIGAPPRS